MTDQASPSDFDLLRMKLEEDLNRIVQQLSAVCSDNGVNTAQIQNVAEYVAHIKKYFEETNDEIEKMKTYLCEELAEFEHNTDQRRSEIALLNQEVQQAKDVRAGINAEIEDLKIMLMGLHSNVESAKAAKDQCDKEYEAQLQQVEDLKQQVNPKKNQLATMTHTTETNETMTQHLKPGTNQQEDSLASNDENLGNRILELGVQAITQDRIEYEQSKRQKELDRLSRIVNDRDRMTYVLQQDAQQLYHKNQRKAKQLDVGLMKIDELKSELTESLQSAEAKLILIRTDLQTRETENLESTEPHDADAREQSRNSSQARIDDFEEFMTRLRGRSQKFHLSDQELETHSAKEHIPTQRERGPQLPYADTGACPQQPTEITTDIQHPIESTTTAGENPKARLGSTPTTAAIPNFTRRIQQSMIPVPKFSRTFSAVPQPSSVPSQRPNLTARPAPPASNIRNIGISVTLSDVKAGVAAQTLPTCLIPEFSKLIQLVEGSIAPRTWEEWLGAGRAGDNGKEGKCLYSLYHRKATIMDEDREEETCRTCRHKGRLCVRPALAENSWSFYIAPGGDLSMAKDSLQYWGI